MIEEFDNKYLQDFTYETTILGQDGRIVGSCELGKATIQMLNKSNQYSDLKGTWIKTIHGSFYIYDVKPVQEKINIKLECYDIKYKLNTKYDSSLYTFPMTLKEWRNAIFANSGVEYDDSDFPNSDLILNEEPYLDKGIKNIQVISLIAEAGASNVITDVNDIFYFSWLENVTHVVKDWLELTTEKTLTSSINAIVLGRGTGDDIFYPNPTPENSHIFRIDNNYILDPQSINEEDRRNQVIEPIYNRLNGFSYITYSMRSQNIDNKLSVKLGQKINYTDIWGNDLTSIVMTKKIHWLGGNPEDSINYEIHLSAEECNDVNDSNGSQNSLLEKINAISRKADKQAGIIEDFIEEIDGPNGKLTQVIQNVEGITQTVSDIESITSNVEVFRTELDTNNIIIPVDSTNHPLETANYDVDYSSTYIGNVVSVVPTTTDIRTGIIVAISGNTIRFGVNEVVPIPNLDNKYTFTFEYIDPNGKEYTTTKSIVLSLIPKGEDGVPGDKGEIGPQGPQGLKGTDGKDASIQSATTPSDTSQMWYDTNTNELKRYNGNEWIVVNDYSNEIDSVSDLVERLESLTKEELDFLSGQVQQLQTTMSSSLEQTKSSFEMQFKTVQEEVANNQSTTNKQVNGILEYIHFEGSSILLGKSNSPCTLKMTEQDIKIMYNGKEISSWIKDVAYFAEIHIGKFAFIPLSNGSLSFRRVG